MSYSTPTRDMGLCLNHMAGFGALMETVRFSELNAELTAAILSEMAKFCDDVLAPLNWESDQNGARLDAGKVLTTPGFKEAYEQYAGNGWNGLAFPEAVGGQGLPSTLAVALVDAMNAACMSFAIGTTLTTGAVKAFLHAATEDQKQRYLEKLVSGAWTATMNLTESQSGSDLADIRTKAEPVGDGRYRITGQKIYITYGEHDLTENIIHLVLARLPDAPAGTAGISMFVVPKFHVNDDGSIGERNDVHCVGLEEKMGLHGSPTCVMAYGENGACYGTLLGEENRGLQNMFVMMNAARLDVGVQGVGIAERAFQQALAYAQERRQGRSITARGGEMVPIIDHPDVRRTLYLMRSLVDASRAICYANAVAYDLSKAGDDTETREKNTVREALLTPISKAWATDRANEVTSLGIQVHGGMGYIEETGAAQYLRDARIAAIYEGTNGIQAIDLVGRKLQKDGGAGVAALASEIAANVESLKSHADATLQNVGSKLDNALKAMQFSTDWLLKQAPHEPEDPLSGATAYLRQMGNVVGGHYLALGVQSMIEANEDAALIDAKKGILKVYADNILTEAVGLTAAVVSGAETYRPIEPSLLAG